MKAKCDARFVKAIKNEWAACCRSAKPQALVSQMDRLRKLQVCSDYDTTSAFAIAYAAFQNFHPAGITLYDEQLLCAQLLLDGRVVEMDNGEGKTYAAATAALVSLMLPRTPLGARRVFVTTQNDYLSQRDADELAHVYASLGFSVGLVSGNQGRTYTLDRSSGAVQGADCSVDDALQRDVIYLTLSKLIFTHLSDEVRPPIEQVLSLRDYLILDEADSVLLDQARRPYHLSKAPKDLAWKSAVADRVVRQLVEGRDFLLDRFGQRSLVTEHGYRRVETLLGIQNLFLDAQDRPWHWYIRDAIRAHHFCVRGDDYEVLSNRVLTYDSETGRLTDNRLRDGLHEAVQAKEGFVSTPPSEPLRTTTPAVFIKTFRKICGLTATAKSVASELRSLYGLRTARVNRRLPSRLAAFRTLFASDRVGRICHTVKVAATAVGMHRPILINTQNELDSRCVAALLRFLGFQVNQIKADEPDSEPNIVAAAGRPWQITVTAKLAARGTEITIPPRIRASVTPASDGREIGLFVIGSGFSEDSARADKQLAGRTARRGMPGSVQFICDLDDPLFRLVLPVRMRAGLMRMLADGDTLSHRWLDISTDSAKRQRDWYDRMRRNTQADIETILDRLAQPWFRLRNILTEAQGVELMARALIRFFTRSFAKDRTGTGIGVPGSVDITALCELLGVHVDELKNFTYLHYGARVRLVESISLDAFERLKPLLTVGSKRADIFDILWEGLDCAWRSFRRSIDTTVDRLTLYYRPAPPPAWALEQAFLESWRRETDFLAVWGFCHVVAELRRTDTNHEAQIPELLHWSLASRADIRRVLSANASMPSGVDEKEDLSVFIQDWNSFASDAAENRKNIHAPCAASTTGSSDFVGNAMKRLEEAVKAFAEVEPARSFLPTVYRVLLSGVQAFPECHLAVARAYSQAGIPLSNELNDGVAWARPILDAAQSPARDELPPDVALLRLGLLLRSHCYPEVADLLAVLAARNDEATSCRLSDIKSRCEAYRSGE